MMKKWFLFLLLLICLTIKNSTIKANSDYKSYQEIEVKGGVFLSDYKESDFKKHYKKVDKRKFWGWRINEVYTDLKVDYKTETLFSYYNDGTTPFNYDYSYKKNESSSLSLSSTGSIKIDASGSIQKFKGGLNSSLSVTSTKKRSKDETEEFKVKVTVDPGTMLNLYILGEGKLTNGVAANYFCWLRTQRGGFEVFTVTTQYYKMEKIKIWLKRFFFQSLFS